MRPLPHLLLLLLLSRHLLCRLPPRVLRLLLPGGLLSRHLLCRLSPRLLRLLLPGLHRLRGNHLLLLPWLHRLRLPLVESLHWLKRLRRPRWRQLLLVL